MIAPLAKLIDWLSIQENFMRMPFVQGHDLRLEEAIRFLKGPNFIPLENQAAQIEFQSESGEFHFPTPQPSGSAEIDVVYGRLYRCPGRRQERPTIILLHAGRDFKGYHFRFPMIAARCNEAGINVATLVSPNDLQRRPRHPPESGVQDYLQKAKTTSQAVAEIRALVGWLLGEGCPAVSLWGFSAGGWLAGLTACHDSRLACAILTVFRSRMNCFPRQRIIWHRVREELERQHAAMDKLDVTPWNLIQARPVIPKENILLMEGLHDLKVPTESIEELWRAWKQPDIWRLPQGHLSCLRNAPSLTNRVLDWLTPRLEAGRKNNL